MSYVKLLRTQSQHAFASALVADHMFGLLQDRALAMKRGKCIEKDMRERLASIESELEVAKTEMINQKNSHLIESHTLTEELFDARRQTDAERMEKEVADKEVIELRGRMAEERETARKSKEEHHEHIQKLKKEIEDLKAARTVPNLSAEEVKAAYEGTEDYKRVVGDFGEFGFELMKKALRKDGKLEPDVIDSYDYIDYLIRSADGLL